MLLEKSIYDNHPVEFWVFFLLKYVLSFKLYDRFLVILVILLMHINIISSCWYYGIMPLILLYFNISFSIKPVT